MNKERPSEIITPEQFELNKHDIKKSWKIIKNMIGMEDGRYSTNQIYFLINGQYISNSNTISNIFNNYFIKVGSSLSSSIKSEIDTLVYFQTNNSSIHISELNKVEIK